MTSIAQEISDALNDYTTFDTQTKAEETKEYQDKLSAFKTLSGDPSFILMMFFSVILVSNGTPHAGGKLKGNVASESNEYLNQLTEVAKELNYASAFRDAVSDMKQKLEDAKNGPSDPNTSQDILTDIDTMEKYMDSSNFSNDAPAIFQGSLTSVTSPLTGQTYEIPDTFATAFNQIVGVVDIVNKPSDQNGYGGDWNKLWTDSQEQGDQVAGGLIQTFTNATDSCFSAVSIQQNVLNTELQNDESDYKSTLSIATQAIKSFNSVISNAIQKSTTQ